MTAFERVRRRDGPGPRLVVDGDIDAVRGLLARVRGEQKAQHHKGAYQVRVNLQKKDDAATYAGWITADNATLGPYQGTSQVWFPGTRGAWLCR